MKSYTNVYALKNLIIHNYVEDGKRKQDRIKFQPFLGVHSHDPKSIWKDIFGKPAEIRVFDDIYSMREWKKENSNIVEILGDVQPPIQFIAGEYPDKIPVQMKGIKIFNLDIEVLITKTGVFPKPEVAEQPISAITIQDMVENKYYVFGLGEYKSTQKNIFYAGFSTEDELLKAFINFFQHEKPDFLTGWNIDNFDIPYLVNRINSVLGENETKRLSPEHIIKIHEKNTTWGKQITYSFYGITTWDYMDLYKKYQSEPREQDSLDFISNVEIGKGKIDFQNEYENLYELYEKNFQLYIDYNIHDVTLVYELNKKLKFIELALSIMYSARCQPEQIFGTVAPWDSLLYFELLKKHVLCPALKQNYKKDFPGGFVKQPNPGMYDNIIVYDIVSSYPNQIRSFNMSLETVVDDRILPVELKEIKAKFNTVESFLDIDLLEEIGPILKKHNVCFAVNGCFFRTDKQGYISDVYTDMFEERQRLKKELEIAKKNKETDKVIALDLAQHAKKIQLNSGYGMLSNIYCRYFDLRIASAITCCAQLSSRGSAAYIEKKLNLVNEYSDTDSNFLNVNPIVLQRFAGKTPTKLEVVNFIIKYCKNIIDPKFHEFFQKLYTNLNTHKQTIEMEFECLSETTIFQEKKRYIMKKIVDGNKIIIDNPKLKIRGIEIVKTSTPQWVRDRLKECVNVIFEHKDNDKLIEFIDKVREDFFKLPIEQIAFPRGANFSNYTLESKSLPIQVRAALKFNEVVKKMKLPYEEIGSGSKIKFCYIKEPNKIGSNVIGFPVKFPNELNFLEIDYKLQFEKSFLSALTGILDAIGWETEKRNSLTDFFS